MLRVRHRSPLYTQTMGPPGDKKMRQASLSYNGEKQAEYLPLIGIYSCLICDRRFSTKVRLKQHYVGTHRQSIPNYTSESFVSARRSVKRRKPPHNIPFHDDGLLTGKL